MRMNKALIISSSVDAQINESTTGLPKDVPPRTNENSPMDIVLMCQLNQ